MATRHEGPCPADGTDARGRCLGACRECGEHRLATGRGTPYCPGCDACPACGCPRADGFAHYAGCALAAEEAGEDEDEGEGEDEGEDEDAGEDAGGRWAARVALTWEATLLGADRAAVERAAAAYRAALLAALERQSDAHPAWDRDLPAITVAVERLPR